MAAHGRGNNGNLKPPESTDEARRRGAVGGRKSGEARRQKKTIAQKIEVMLNRRVTNPKIKKQLCEDFAKDAKTYEDAIIAAQIYQAVKGNTKAFNTLVSLLPKEDEAGGGVRESVFIPANQIAPSFVTLNRFVDNRKYTEYVLKGGRGSGKSSFPGEKIPEIIANNPSMHALACRKVSNTLRDSVFAQIKWGISQLGLDAQFDCTVSPMEITYKPTGQKIYFRGADDPAKIKSIKPPFGYIGALWFEELDQFNGEEEIRNIEQSAIRGTDADGNSECIIFKTFNPPRSAKNWANLYVLKAKPSMCVHHSTYLDMPEEWLGRFFLEQAAELKGINETAYRNEYLGEVTGEGGAVFDNVRERTITEDMINTFGQFRRGLDWGFAVDPFAYVESYYDRRNKSLYIFGEIYGARMGFDQIDEELKKINPLRLAIRADSAEARSNDEMLKRGHEIISAKKGGGVWITALSGCKAFPRFISIQSVARTHFQSSAGMNTSVQRRENFSVLTRIKTITLSMLCDTRLKMI